MARKKTYLLQFIVPANNRSDTFIMHQFFADDFIISPVMIPEDVIEIRLFIQSLEVKNESDI